MKKQKLFFVVVIGLLLTLSITGCTHVPLNKGYKDITDLYTLIQNSDDTYSYSLTDMNGKILFEKQNSAREPKVNQIAPTIYELITQTGTGLSTNWAVYCDVESSKTSETFYYVLATQGDYVVCANYEDGKHFITIQNIFDKSMYFKTYELENVSPIAADFALNCKCDSGGNATITYLTGENYTETQITITIP